MDDRILALLARVERLEKEVAELKKFTGMSDSPVNRKAATGEGADIMEALSKMAPQKGQRVKIAQLRKALEMEGNTFDNALSALSRSGHVALHETGALSLSIKNMGESLMGENGELFTEVSVNQA